MLQHISTLSRYKLKDYSEEEVTGSFFEDELVRYNPSEFYDVKVIKKRKTKRGVVPCQLYRISRKYESMGQSTEKSIKRSHFHENWDEKVPFL